jgi:CheY-like chemotaxis protein
MKYQTRTKTNCRILNVGPDPDAQRLLGELAQTEEGVSLEHVEVGSVALEMLRQLPESDLPSIVIIPFRLAILNCHDFISAMHSHEQLRAIPVLIWGPQIELWEMGQLYREGATSVLLGDFSAAHVDAVRNFCCAWMGVRPAATGQAAPELHKSGDRNAYGQSDHNVQLGTLFLWSGCISAACWVWSVLSVGGSYTLIELAPASIHTSLTCAGLFLLFHHDGRRVTK